MTRPRWAIPAYLYLYRCRKPGALFGFPIIGRHNGYAGQTRNPRSRDIEHTAGGGRYGKGPASWSDLDPKRYLIRLGPCPQWVLNVLERVLILVTAPVYNVQHNRWNPRRITRAHAARQRARRDAMVATGARRGWSPYVGLGHLFLAALVVVMVWWGVQS